MIYFDQAASSFPKPKEVGEAVLEAINEYGANPGRGGHALAVRAADKINKTRSKLSSFFNLKNPKHVLFYQNATGALNQAIKGISFEKGDHVITTSYEHNSVRRPLEFLKRKIGIEITYIQPDESGNIDDNLLEQAVCEKTKLLAVTHGSNLTGLILPVKELGEFAKKHNILFLVDASQTAGILPIDMEEMHIDMLAFAGHKGLLGPQGTGALLVKPNIDLIPHLHGGTGSHSESADQPDQWPERYESGTLNTPGIAGLDAGIEAVEKLTLNYIFEHEWNLTKKLLYGLSLIDEVQIFGPPMDKERLAVVSFMINGIDCHEIAMVLDQHYQIAVRAGMHCTPLGHGSIGTMETGAVRVSFGPYNRDEEVDTFLQAIKEIKTGFLG